MIEVAYLLWDKTHSIKNETVRNHVADIERTNYSMLIPRRDTDVKRGLRSMPDNFTHAVVFRSGTIIKRARKFMKAVTRLCNSKDFLVCGHIMNHKGFYPYLHPQFFVVDLRRFRQLNKSIDWSDNAHIPQASANNIHDDYTPVALYPTDHYGRATFHPRSFGSYLIHESMEEGIPVINVPHNVRNHKYFLYPNDNGDAFGQAIKDMREGKIFSLSHDGQNNHLQSVMDTVKEKAVYVFNSERTSIPNVTNVDKFFCVASGFMPLRLWSSCGTPQSSITLFDFNDVSLTFWKDALKNWDGRDFPAYLESIDVVTNQQYHFGRGSSTTRRELIKIQWETVVASFGDEETFVRQWNAFRSLQFDFVRLDLLDLNDVDTLSSSLIRNSIVWFSNIFNYDPTIQFYGSRFIDKRFHQFKKTMQSVDPIMIGSRQDIRISSRASQIGDL